MMAKLSLGSVNTNTLMILAVRTPTELRRLCYVPAHRTGWAMLSKAWEGSNHEAAGYAYTCPRCITGYNYDHPLVLPRPLLHLLLGWRHLQSTCRGC